jgi:drug/metabolite transporter (DMT)-like permease
VKEKLKPFLGIILGLTGAIFFSAKAVTVKLAYGYGISAIDLLNLRMLFSLPFFVLTPWLLKSKEQYPEPVSRRDWISIILLGLAGYYLASWFDFAGLVYITAGLERLIVFLYPTFVVLFTAYLAKKTVSKREGLALILTYLGLGLVVAQSLNMQDQANVWLGSLLVLGSAITYASYLVGSGKLIPKLGTVRYTSYAMIVSSLAVILHYLIENKFQIRIYQWEVYALGLFMAIFCTVLPSFMISESIRLIGSGKAAIIASVGPVSTITLAYIFLGEEVYWIEIVGTALVLAGVMIISKK